MEHPYDLRVSRIIEGSTAAGQPLHHPPYPVADSANRALLIEASIALTRHCILEGVRPASNADRYVTHILRLLIEYMLQADGRLHASDTFAAMISGIADVLAHDTPPYPTYPSFEFLKMLGLSPTNRTERQLAGLRALLDLHTLNPASDAPPPVVWASEGYYLCRLVSPLQIFEEGLAWGNSLAFRFEIPLLEHAIVYPDCLANLTAYAEVKAGLQLLSFRTQGRRIAMFGLKSGRGALPYERPRARANSFETLMFKRALRDVGRMYRPRRKLLNHAWMHLRLPPLLAPTTLLPALSEEIPAQLSFAWEGTHVAAP